MTTAPGTPSIEEDAVKQENLILSSFLFTSTLVIPLLVSRDTKDRENLVYAILLQTSGAVYTTAAFSLCLYSVPFSVSPSHWEFVMKKNLKCKLLPRPVRNI